MPRCLGWWRKWRRSALAMGQVGLALALWLGPVGVDGPFQIEEALGPAIAQETSEIFFADVLVRGQPVFQVGGLLDINAADRAGQINRRLAALLNLRGLSVTPNPLC